MNSENSSTGYINEEVNEDGMISEDEIIENIVGTDPDGDPKAVIGVALIRYENDGREKKLAEFVPEDTILSRLYFVGDFCVIQLDFKASGNIWLKRVKEVIDQYHESPYDHVLGMTFTDITGGFPYCFSLANPLISMNGYNTETRQASLLQIAFDIEDVMVGELDYSIDSLRADIARDQNIMNYEAYQAEELDAENNRILDEMDENASFMGDQFGPDKVFRTAEVKTETDDKIRFTEK